MDPSARDDASSYGATAEIGRASDAALRTRGRAHLAKSTVVAALLTLAALAAALVALGGPARPLALGRRHRAATAADASFSALLVSNASSAPAELTVSQTHIKDNRPLYYIAPAGANAGKVSMVCLSPKVWSTSMGMLLLAGHRPEEVRASPRDVNGVAKAHDSLTVPSASVSGTKAGNESGESVDGLTRDDRYFITRDPLDRLYSGYRAKIACVDLHPQTEAMRNVLKYLPSVFWKPKRDEKRAGEAGRPPRGTRRGSRRKSGRWTSGVSCRTRTCARSRRTCWSRASSRRSSPSTTTRLRWTAHWRG